jgi:Family of unknown function (DUF695)
VRLFQRSEPTDSDPIAAFWHWWSSRAVAVAAAIGDGTTPALSEEISAKVDAMHADLQWELAPGAPSRHALCVTAAGVPELRPLAERWLRQAPPADATWEYQCARAPDPSALDSVLEFGAHRVELRLARVGVEVDDERQLLNVRVYHPMFASMPEGARGQITFLMLDWLLGEDGVVRWLGSISPITDEPADAIGADALPDVVAGLMARNDAVTWALLRGERDGAIVLVTARRPLKWIDYPLYDQHIGVSLGYTDRTPQELPDPDELDRLRATEDDLMAALGSHGLFVAHETSRGSRTWHIYADGEREDAVSRVRAWIAGVPGATVSVEDDPGWRMVRAYS